MPASANKQVRLQSSLVNVAANRIARDDATIALVRACIRRALLRREQQLERPLTLGEAESVCEHAGLADVLAFIRDVREGHA